MQSLSFSRTWLLCLASFLPVAGSVRNSEACGPWFPDSLLQAAYSAIKTPVPIFEVELESIELDVSLPGGLVVPAKMPPSRIQRVRRPNEGPKSPYKEHEYLDRLSSEDLLENKEGCRDLLLSSPSELAREMGEFAEILARRPMAANAFEAIADRTLLDDYEKIRRVLYGLEKNPEIQAQIDARGWPQGLPDEFIDYLDGAAAFREKDYEKAIGHFEKLLARPQEERLYRSTLASYMIGRCRLAQGDPDMGKSIPHFRRVLTLREEGCYDNFRVGWDALKCVADYTSKFEGNPGLAVRYYFAHARTGDEFSRNSLSELVKKIDVKIAAKDPFLRRIRTACLFEGPQHVSYWSPDQLSMDEKQETWLSAMEEAEVYDVDACRLAWLSYQVGEFERAERWLNRAREYDEVGHWVQAKLDLQQGRTSQARRALEEVRPSFEAKLDHPLSQPRTEQWSYVRQEGALDFRSSQYWGDLGMVRLAEDDVVGALDAFVKSGYWYEVAYVAEQLLSRDELLRWVLDHCPDDPYFVPHRERTIHARLRYLTARRLARDHYFKNARDLMPDELVPIFDRYVEGYRVLLDSSREDGERIEKGWEAAQIHRKLGMEYFGTELGPDWFCLGKGSFSSRSYAEVRSGESAVERFDAEFSDHFRNPLAEENRDECRNLRWSQSEPVEGNLPATRAERWRLEHYGKLPYVSRFHYRSVAQDLAWEVVRLMPQDDDEAARILAIAGSWTHTRTPRTADFFYKQLVNRNRNTALGSQADIMRWFPDVDWDFNPWELTGSEKPKGWSWWY